MNCPAFGVLFSFYDITQAEGQIRVPVSGPGLLKKQERKETMTIYERMKAAVPIRRAAEHYGLKVSRNGMACCPFHNDGHPSMKLNEEYFFCFGCGAKGDVIAFTSRFLGISTQEATKKLADDFGISAEPEHTALLAMHKHPHIRQFREDEMLCIRVLTDYLHLLDGWKEKYAPQTPNDAYDERFAESCRMLDTVNYLLDCLTVAPMEARVAMVDRLMQDGQMEQFHRYIKRIQEEIRHEPEPDSCCV